MHDSFIRQTVPVVGMTVPLFQVGAIQKSSRFGFPGHRATDISIRLSGCIELTGPVAAATGSLVLDHSGSLVSLFKESLAIATRARPLESNQPSMKPVFGLSPSIIHIFVAGCTGYGPRVPTGVTRNFVQREAPLDVNFDGPYAPTICPAPGGPAVVTPKTNRPVPPAKRLG